MAISSLNTKFCAAALLAFLATGAAAQETDTAAEESPAPAEDRLLATVNGIEIRETQVTEAIASLPPQLQQLPPDMLLPMIADQLVTGELIAEAAIAAGLQSDPVVQARARQAERQILQQTWLERQVEAQLTPERLDAAYQEYLAANPPVEVSARHILVATEDEARDLIEQLKGGADFNQLAQEKSIDTGSGANGGDLGWFAKGMMVPPFSDAAFALQPGEFTQEPVETQFGWHVIRVDDRRDTEAPTLDAMRPELEQTAQQALIEQVIGDLRAGAEIVVYGPDGQPIPE